MDQPNLISRIDSQTFASNPGRIKIVPHVHWMCYPAPLLSAAGAAVLVAVIGIATFALGINVKLPWWISIIAGIATGLWLLVQEYQLKSQWLWNGDTNPAIVVDPASGLIAVWADMSSNGKHIIPAIKVLRTPLVKGAGNPHQRGQRLTTICLYVGAKGKSHWDDVTPIPAACATSDVETMERSMSGVPNEQWLLLEHGLTELGKKSFEPGIYFLDSQRSERN